MNGDNRAEERLRAVLVHREGWYTLRRWVQLLAGIVLSFIGPLLLATIFWFCAWTFSWSLRWEWLFLAMCAVTLPLLFHIEARRGREFLSDILANRTADLQAGAMFAAQPYGTMFVMAGVFADPRAASAGMIEWFLMGPRLVIGATRAARLAHHWRGVDRSRAAHVLETLRQREHGLPVAKMLQGGETLNDLLPVLSYLADRGWVGFGGEDGLVYLYSESRDKINRIAAAAD